MVDQPYVGSSAEVKKGGKPPKMELSRIEIEPSENGGFVAKCYMRESKSDRNRSTYCGWHEPETYTFETFDSLVAWLKKKVG